MRDFRDAKAMAQTLRQALNEKSVDLSQSESLELVARLLGFHDWNVLAARIKDGETHKVGAGTPAGETPDPALPLIPLRDLVMFPEMVVPIYVGRYKSKRAVEQATSSHKRLFVVAQKDANEDDPPLDALYRCGVVVELLKVLKLPDGAMKLIVQGLHRAKARRYWGDDCLYADVESLAEDKIGGPETAELAREAVRLLQERKTLNPSAPQHVLTKVPGYVEWHGLMADNVAQWLSVSIDERQRLLEMTSVEDRLRRILELMNNDRQAA